MLEIHKTRIYSVQKKIDNSSPDTLRLKKYISKSPTPRIELENSNSRMYNKLNKIYSRPIVHPEYIKSFRPSQLINRDRKTAKIASENEILAQRLINKKSNLSLKRFQVDYKVITEYKGMISKINKLKKLKLLK